MLVINGTKSWFTVSKTHFATLKLVNMIGVLDLDSDIG